MDSITKILVEAGYFRARISTLSDFDKIIGGMAWAMQVFSYDVNINIFYTDSLDLGQKIALTERLVMVLLVMNCPQQIEPHQIVGLDYANLLPVLRWLIKRSTEVRREHEAFNRLLALRHFHRVTNSLSDRSEWCHIVPIDHLKKLDHLSSNNKGVDTPMNGSLDGSLALTSSLIDRLNREFKDNRQVSFVQLPSLIRATNRVQDRVESVTDSREASTSDEDDQQETAKIDPAKVLPKGDRSQNESLKQQDQAEPSSEKDALSELHIELDTELLATNQKILNLLRKLDSMPSQLEISQYQKRYIELHQQLISKNKDVKKLYALYNSLDSTKHYLTKEINLLDSIFANLDLTNDSAENREQFLNQFQDIILKIQKVRDDVVLNLNILRQKCEALNAEYNSIVD